MILSASLVGLPVVAAMLLLGRCTPDRHWAARLPIALALGLGLSSVVWWGLLLTPLDSPSRLLTADAAIWLLVVGFLLVSWKRRARSVVATATPAPAGAAVSPQRRAARLGPSDWIIIGVAAVTLGCAVLSFAASSGVMAHGEWDAWAIWNLRARFIHAGFPAHWREMFSPALGWSHPDYPLLLPITVARAWSYAGNDSSAVPMALSLAWASSAVCAAAVAAGRTHSLSRGFLTAAAILASPTFVRYAASQCADLPVALFMLISLLLLSDALAAGAGATPLHWLLAGAAAGLAAWTKNEGLLFLLLYLLIVSAWLLRRMKLTPVALLVLGAAPMIVAIVAVKSLAPPNDIVTTQSLATMGSTLDAHRVSTVAMRVALELWFGGGRYIGVLPLLAAFACYVRVVRPVDPAVAMGATIVVLMLVGYGAIYVLTPHDLTWHMNTSLDRVLLQLFPMSVWCIMSAARA